MITPIPNDIAINQCNPREGEERHESANYNDKCREIGFSPNCSPFTAKNARNHKENEQFVRSGKYSRQNTSTRSSKAEDGK